MNPSSRKFKIQRKKQREERREGKQKTQRLTVHSSVPYNDVSVSDGLHM
jgi:hypothetical protein